MTDLPVPPAVLAPIAETYRKPVVVLVALDDANDQTHFVSYGVGPVNKMRAAALADMIHNALLPRVLHHLKRTFYDFRLLDAAEAAERIERLTQMLAHALLCADSSGCEACNAARQLLGWEPQ